MNPLPFLSSANQASSEPAAVHDKFSATPLLFRSKATPAAALVRSKPFPLTSITIGE